MTTKELTEETRNEERREKERVKRIEKIKEKLESLSSLSELSNEIILEYDEKGLPLVQIDPLLYGSFKKHQKDGVQFMYLNTVESIEHLVKNKGKGGNGTILAHNPGLGKTFQIITFVHCLLTNEHTKAYFKSALILVPKNVLINWTYEFNKWIKDKGLQDVKIFRFNDCSNYTQKICLFKSWQEDGGIMLMGHQTFTNLIVNKNQDEPEEFTKLFELVLLDPGN